MKFIKIVKEPVQRRWYTGEVGQAVEYIEKYDDQELYGVRDLDGYINFVVKTDGEIVEIK